MGITKSLINMSHSPGDWDDYTASLVNYDITITSPTILLPYHLPQQYSRKWIIVRARERRTPDDFYERCQSMD